MEKGRFGSLRAAAAALVLAAAPVSAAPVPEKNEKAAQREPQTIDDLLKRDQKEQELLQKPERERNQKRPEKKPLPAPRNE